MRPLLSGDMTIQEILEKKPELVSSLIKLGLHCVGCPAENFHTLKEVAREYGLDQGELIKHLHMEIESSDAS